MSEKNYIVSLQTLLQGRNAEFDASKRIKIVRHKDTRGKEKKLILGQQTKLSIHSLYKQDRQRFLDYQSEQNDGTYDNVDFVVSCLGEQSTLSRFIGVFKVIGKVDGMTPTKGQVYYKMVELPEFQLLKERVIFDWGNGAVSWNQYYLDNIKYVHAIHDKPWVDDGVPTFISYNDINLSFDELKAIFDKKPIEWKSKLEAVNCIYLIQDCLNGKQYIGSTYTKQGAWFRWKQYADTNGHGKDVELKKLIDANPDYAHNFHWTILETLPITITASEAVERESMYKDKFMTRQFGYNKN